MVLCCQIKFRNLCQCFDYCKSFSRHQALMMTKAIGQNVTNKSFHFQVKSSLHLCRSQLRKSCMTLMLNVHIIVRVIAWSWSTKSHFYLKKSVLPSNVLWFLESDILAAWGFPYNTTHKDVYVFDSYNSDTFKYHAWFSLWMCHTIATHTGFHLGFWVWEGSCIKCHLGRSGRMPLNKNLGF